jgi:hypothetical protein
MNQGGINNAALIGASQRQARNKLDMMAGIQRPQGILASSPQLMQAVMQPKAPMPMPMPMAPVPDGQPAPVPMAPPPMMPAAPALPSLPQLPMNTAVAPMPSSPAVPRPASSATPMKFAPGTAVDVREDFNPKFQGDVPASAIPRFGRGADRVDITKEATPLLFSMDAELQRDAVNKFGSIEAAEKAASEKGSAMIAALEVSKDPAKVAGAVLNAAEVPNTDEGKMDFAQTVLGIDTNDIGEIDDAIFKVLTSKSDATGEEFQQAVLLGLQNYKQTIAARSAAASGGKSGMSPKEDEADAVRDLAGKLIAQGIGFDEAMAQAQKFASQYYGEGTPSGGQEDRITMYDPSGKPFYSTDGTNFVDADGNPYVPPTTA